MIVTFLILIILQLVYSKNKYITLKLKGDKKIAVLQDAINKEIEQSKIFKTALKTDIETKSELQEKINTVNVKILNLCFSYEELIIFYKL